MNSKIPPITNLVLCLHFVDTNGTQCPAYYFVSDVNIAGNMISVQSQALLDDQIVRVQSMRASPFIGPLERESTEWDDLLNTLQDILDNWMQCQATWQYLEPVFSSPDIMKQMPEEGEKFLQVADPF